MTARSETRKALLLRAEKARKLSIQADTILTSLDSVVDELAALLKVMNK